MKIVKEISFFGLVQTQNLFLYPKNNSKKKLKMNDRRTKITSTSKSVTEADPLGKDPHQPGAKLDAGKPCIWRGAIGYFPRAIREVAAVSTFGASKYAWKGWETVPEGFDRYSDAMVRHLVKEGEGELSDLDSGLVHAAHTAWNALARLELLLREQKCTTS